MHSPFLTQSTQFDNPIAKPASAASALSDDASGGSGAAACTPRQRIEIAYPLNASESIDIGSKNSRVSTRDMLVHLPFKPRRRAVEASQVSPHCCEFAVLRLQCDCTTDTELFCCRCWVWLNRTCTLNHFDCLCQPQPPFPHDIVITVVDHRNGNAVHTVQT
jgi:hypothetical protein